MAEMQLLENNYLLAALLFFGVFLLTLYVIPRVRENALKFGYLDTPEERSSHSKVTPTFGGVAFYIALILGIFCIRKFDMNSSSANLVVSITIMFFVGLKDDLKNLSPKKKFLGQFIAVALLMFEPELRITSLHGVLGIYELSTYISIILSTFVVLGLINAYNLIDGIDGLASIVGIIIFSFFGYMFFKLHYNHYLYLCFVCVAMLLAFLRYNLSSKKKIFMGDTGSLIVGLILGFMMLKLLAAGSESLEIFSLQRKDLPLLLISILIIPIFDFHRVLLIRALRGKSIFSPDRNHMHHVLLDAGLSHIKASIICGLINVFTVLFVFYSLKEFSTTTVYVEFIAYLILLSVLFFGLSRSTAAKRSKVKLRNFLFRMSRLFVDNGRKTFSESRLAFNQGLKKIRIFFF